METFLCIYEKILSEEHMQSLSGGNRIIFIHDTQIPYPFTPSQNLERFLVLLKEFQVRLTLFWEEKNRISSGGNKINFEEEYTPLQHALVKCIWNKKILMKQLKLLGKVAVLK